VVCQDQAYHLLLHERQRAYDGCGHPDWKYCRFCDTWAPVDQLSRSGAKTYYHPACINTYNREKYHARKRESQ
jgi:hypothetical protein